MGSGAQGAWGACTDRGPAQPAQHAGAARRRVAPSRPQWAPAPPLLQRSGEQLCCANTPRTAGLEPSRANPRGRPPQHLGPPPPHTHAPERPSISTSSWLSTRAAAASPPAGAPPPAPRRQATESISSKKMRQGAACLRAVRCRVERRPMVPRRGASCSAWPACLTGCAGAIWECLGAARQRVQTGGQAAVGHTRRPLRDAPPQPALTSPS